MEPGSTTLDDYKCLDDLFQDNQNAHVIAIEQEFSTVHMETFLNIFAYCQPLNTLSDKLCDVGAPVNNHCLVLHLIFGLTDDY